MARAENAEIIDRFEEFYRSYYRNEIGELAQRYPGEQKSLYVDWNDLYRFDPDMAEDFLAQPAQMQEYAEEALRLYDLPVDVKLGSAHVRLRNVSDRTGIRDIRADHVGNLIAVQGIVRKATDVRPKMRQAAFECQRCGTMTRIPQSDGEFQEPHECQGCERQGPFAINFDQSEFVDSQKIRVQESPEGLRGGETPQAIDVNIEDDITGKVTAGDHVTITGILRLEQQGSEQEKSPVFDFYMDGMTVTIEDEQFEEMDISEEDKKRIIELSNDEEIYEKMVESMAPSIYGYEKQKKAIILQLFSGVRKNLPDGSRIRGDLHILLIGDPGTGKSQLLQYVKQLSPRSVYTSGKGSSSAGLTAAAVRDDFAEGQQWTLEAGALVLADQGVAAIDELDKMRCVTGDTLVHFGDRIARIEDFAHEAAEEGEVETLPNGRTIRDIDADAWTMTEDGQLVKRPVTAVHEYDAPDELVAVTTETGERLTTTADHPYFVFTDGQRVETPASDLGRGDWIYVPRGLHESVSDGGTTVAEPAAAGADDAHVTPALAAVLGYLAGDGNLYYEPNGGPSGIRFTNSEEELLSDFERVCRLAFDAEPVRPPSEQRADGVETVRLIGREYADRVIEAGMNRETYDGKRLPEAVTAGSRTAKAAFVRALADSEGSVDERSVTIHSASYELLLGVKQLLLEFGVSSQIQHRERPEQLDLHLLVVTDAASLQRFARSIGFTLRRKQDQLTDAVERVSGDRTILDVIPDIGDELADIRSSLRLYQAECGISDATYCDFENGRANVSIRLGRKILDAFESRKQTAQHDLDRVADADWATLTTLTDRYHVTQTEIAQTTRYSQPRVSELWGDDAELRETVADRLALLIRDVATADLSPLRELVSADVKWRRVASVETVSPESDTDTIRLLRAELAELLGCEESVAVETARTMLADTPELNSWDGLKRAADEYDIAHRQIASDLDVHQTTVTRWLNGTVETDRQPAVAAAVRRRIVARRGKIRTLLSEVEARQTPTVYDLTVEGTHNFVANGMVVHNSEDQSAMHQALEQQEISISKAGINATLKSRCSLLGAANPIHGRFDEYEPMAEQIDLDPPLISRFDLIFTVTDRPDEEEDRALAEHIIETNYAGELFTHRESVPTSNVTEEEVESVGEDVEPTIDTELLRKYVAHAKRSCFPTMTAEAKDAIRDFYVELRLEGQGENNPIPVTARKLEALVRLAEASARVRLSDTVEREDAERVIDIVRSSLEDVGIDPETGELDADIIESGTSKSQRDRIKNIKGIISELEDEYQDGAPVEEVYERAEAAGMDREKAEHEIGKLRQKGEIYEPTTDHLRAV
ncbi:LAGLIDADG family homing endonuclease [Halosegnis sp.]|uniref:LAGLIDADG family homing endonuclease n=1 Tax=Halosegnis sp. TaxID=2864959 RepID=UPI0035D4FBA5